MTNDPDAWIARWKAEAEQRERTVSLMKPALLDALKARGVATVIADYDGEGDSGQIERIMLRDGAGAPVTADRPLTLALASGSRQYASLAEAVDAFAWDVLAVYHAGFENNDGGFGMLEIQVAERTVRIDHNDRIIEVSNTLTEV